MEGHELLHSILYLHRIGSDTLKVVPEKEEFKDLRDAIKELKGAIEHKVIVSPDVILKSKEI